LSRVSGLRAKGEKRRGGRTPEREGKIMDGDAEYNDG
jgi:hypothetical protein